MSVLGDHAPGGDHHCSVDTDVSARPGLFSGMYAHILCCMHASTIVLQLSVSFTIHLQPSTSSIDPPPSGHSQNSTPAVSLLVKH